MEREKKILLETINSESDGLKEYLSQLQNVLTYVGLHSYKSSSKSTSERKIGNDLYIKQSHDAEMHRRIFVQYNKSMAYALADSEELALAHANRSAFLLHIKKYENSITDIDAALSITKSKLLQFKLLCRKVECLRSLGSNSCGKIIDAAQSCLDSIIKIEKTKLYNLQNQLDKVKSMKLDNDCSHSTEPQFISDVRNQTLEKKEKIISNAITVKYNKTYGRHIVANKDFCPGDVIFTEKPFITIINDDDMDRYMFCEHCLKPLWSAVSCKICCWAMYCGENCRDKAFTSYHKVECGLISKWEYFGSDKSKIDVRIRIILKAVEEFGSLENLQLQLKTWDDHKDSYSNFIEDDKITDNFRGMYSLYFNDNNKFVRKIIPLIPYMLIFLLKNNFVKNWDIHHVEDLITNEEITFLGAFLIRISSICFTNGITIPNDGSAIYDYKMNKESKGFNLALLTSLINHSCHPNSSWTSSENNDIIVYASQPIKKNEQIFISYLLECKTASKSERLKILKERYNFVCACQKCTNDWPSLEKWESMIAIRNQVKLLESNGYEKSHFTNLINDKEGISSVNSIKPPGFTALFSIINAEFKIEMAFNPKDESFKKCF